MTSRSVTRRLSVQKGPIFPQIVVSIPAKVRAVRIRQLCENALKEVATADQLAEFKLDCLDKGTLLAAQKWVTVKL